MKLSKQYLVLAFMVCSIAFLLGSGLTNYKPASALGKSKAQASSVIRAANSLKKSIVKAVEEWQPYKKECDSDWISTIEDLYPGKTEKISTEEIEKAERKLGYQLPAQYLKLIKSYGSFSFGNTELVLYRPAKLGTSIGDLIEDRIPDNKLGNIQNGHYHDFIILAEYGSFPQQIDDYSSGLAFNRKNNKEIIEYSCDRYWLSEDPKKRLEYRADFFEFLDKRINCLKERLEEPLGGLAEEIKYYKSSEN